MRMRARGAVLILAAVFAAACGDGDGGDSPVEPPTPVRSATPTATATPEPTCSPTIPVEPCVEAAALALTIRSLPGAHVDVGSSGIWHDVPLKHGGEVSFGLDCPIDGCTVDGSNLAGRSVGAPLPLSAGGVSLCVRASYREAVTGTYDGCNGCSELSAKLSVQVFAPEGADAPCPTCVDDPTPNDGRKRGTCRGGTTPGAACDVSNDCLPSGTGIADLAIDLNPLTTKTVSVAPSVDCVSGAFPTGACFCPGQMQPNACEPDGVCPPSGVCELGPFDSVCQGQPFRPCRSGTGTDDCEARSPGAGSCVDEPRPCFAHEIARTGTCGTTKAELVSIVCVPETGDAAIDSAIGLPGPAAIALPVSQIRIPR